ncbi:MAG: hypothetical protein IPL59_21275 [Candidatus Competibacteraceae bacterium]|uniref:hypothetical protein n=1 Tax=Candidatus Contendibacter odensensis TaxID=1400860 RepID=UPI0005549AAE|nr:hypothetical protein [Candidatus Contendobacter odensis]MBK8537412.1 hypothetical protein [Candidatus Competibacteraceae bacterium]MBK8753783.1 hypothetical protein [Candidatus Competibacteraceae bacterium]
MLRFQRTIRAPRLEGWARSEFSDEKFHAACPDQPRRIRYPLVEGPAQRRATNPDEPPPVLALALGLTDLNSQRRSAWAGVLKVDGHQDVSAFEDFDAHGRRLPVLAGNRR